ncbi:uncharacterized protein BYT42DRAFT_641428 [Radiomyces spectabilis]|uniref:uncharacterized protein n=1 Tax=Radiomyces spectabilis TaxID=64574 RepID=UPI00222064C7|nr:uncharacterized protein BYT42DRAFT_641428 [Radiomyces spectabilis]KAI8390853.1 hypothetical protein BYT42DRAFT_641428 [Radiomyces spectabilis]
MDYRDERLEPSRYRVIRWFGFDRFKPEKAVTSYWVSSKTFLAIRLVVTLYSTIVIWADIATTAMGEGGFSHFFAFFTNLTYVGLHAYLVTATYHHVRYLMSNPRRPSSFLDQPTILNYLYVYLYHTVIVYNILTPVVFWAVLAKPLTSGQSSSLQSASETSNSVVPQHMTTISWWMECSVHAASFFMMMSEVIFSRMQVYINMILFVFFTVVLYMFLTFIIFAVDHFWVYPFLDWSQGGMAAVWYIVVGVIVVVFFFLQMLFHWIRNRIARKLGRAEYSPEAIEFAQQNRQEMAQRNEESFSY